MAQSENLFPVATKILAQPEKSVKGNAAMGGAQAPLTDFFDCAFLRLGGGDIYSLEPPRPRMGGCGVG